VSKRAERQENAFCQLGKRERGEAQKFQEKIEKKKQADVRNECRERSPSGGTSGKKTKNPEQLNKKRKNRGEANRI